MEEDKRNKVDAWIIDTFRPFAKTWLEIVRNAFVVGFLIFVAKKSHSTFVSVISICTILIFMAYCLSFILLSIPPYRSTAPNRFFRWALNLGAIVFLGLIARTWSDALSKVLFELAELQVK